MLKKKKVKIYFQECGDQISEDESRHMYTIAPNIFNIAYHRA